MANGDADRLLRCLARGLDRSSSHGVQGCAPPMLLDPRLIEEQQLQSSHHEVSPLKPVESSEIRPGVFYGSPVGKPSNRPPQIDRLLRQIREDFSLQEDQPRQAVWSTFARQEQAIEFVDNHGRKDLAIFVYQDHVTGQRRFLATTYAEFWKRYNGMPPHLRHHYEVIREECPCHLYFDVEFNRAVNEFSDGEQMVDLLLEAVAATLLQIFSIQYHSSWTLELDSSTKDKFSRHLVVHVPKAAFKNNLHAGAFVVQMCTSIQTDERYQKLYVMEGDSRETLQSKIFVDQAVYSRNRSFRLPFSSKAGKTAILLPTYRFGHQGTDNHAIFMESLVCKVDPDSETLLTVGEEATGSGRKLPFRGALTSGSDRGHSPFTPSGASPFPAVDAFIESVVSVGNVNGKIRSWYWFSDYGVLVYNIMGTRFCERIGRQHKSNSVMYIVDFRIAGYYQKCHDPDCRGYKSPVRPIPRDIIPPDFPLSTAMKVVPAR